MWSSKISTSQGQICQQSLRSKGASRGLAALDSIRSIGQMAMMVAPHAALEFV
jgi:hypothetical protein